MLWIFTDIGFAAIANGGAYAGLPKAQDDCRTTTDSTYNHFLADGSYVSAIAGSGEAKAFQNGTTPVLTMFFNLPGQASNASYLSEPEIHLSCLKTIPTEQQQAKINNGVRLMPVGALPFVVLGFLSSVVLATM